ncbi:hypothetical protein Nepgr_013746 [Nepenthes gracilis]|uniref:Bifunctional inhibitor/plant lipid transfer protein/seed storage helical domain-containing protein n=1 Tax=Nepenthes gracilis TaxID=150966 RepID=A0AAD3SJE7_NEPGR|nr:hypothetical protein Nepgr_013746 [Nepenthes gracilis]
MATGSHLSATIFATVILSLLFCTTLCNACGGHPTCSLPSPPPPKPPKPSPSPPPVVVSPPAPPSCPRDALKLGVCADLLGLVNVVIGAPPSGSECCALLEGLVDLEAALCLCTAIKANVLGIHLDVPVALSVLLSACQKSVPPGFTC